jgi:hypothetical protein
MGSVERMMMSRGATGYENPPRHPLSAGDH